MVKDTKMEDTTSTTTKEDTKTKDNPNPPTAPPLEAAARRLERLLGGGTSDKERQMYMYGNPVKVVRRWLGTASGAAGEATSSDIVSAASILLDPKPQSQHGDDRTLMLLKAIEVEETPYTSSTTTTTTMEVEGEEEMTKEKEEKKDNFLSIASRREIESWLLSLQVRILWKDEKYSDAMELVQKGIVILLEQVTVAVKKVTSKSASGSVSSLFPLLARLYRYRSLIADSMNDPTFTVTLRQEMAKAHNMACLRRDVDSQATLLNLMLRDLLLHSQGELHT
jgi:hypothetical protein